MRQSLAQRLIISAAVWAVAVLLIGGFVQAKLYADSARARLDDELKQMSTYLAAIVEVDDQQRLTIAELFDARFERVFSGHYWQISYEKDEQVVILARSRSLWDQELSVVRHNDLGQVRYDNATGPQAEPLRAATLLVNIPGSVVPLSFSTAFDSRPVSRDIRHYVTGMLIALITLASGLIVAMIIQVRVGLRPLYKMRADLSAIQTGEKARLDGDYPKELRPLSSEINSLIDHSEGVVQKARARVGDLAHALKTPIAVLNVEAEKDTTPLGQLVKERVGKMSEQVDRYLRLARATARSSGLGTQTSIHDVVEPLCRVFNKIHIDRDLNFHIQIAPSLRVPIEHQDLEEMLGNILDNAAKWAKSTIHVTAEKTPSGVMITVSDDGPGMTDQQASAMLSRGERLDETAPGSGLGLSIVKDLCAAYAIDIQMSRSDLGGLQVQFTIPNS